MIKSGHSTKPDFSKVLASCPTAVFPMKYVKTMCNSSKHCVQTLEMGLLRKGQKGIVENLWLDFFSDPSQWWDHRSEKLNARYPDFKHKKTQQSLWLNGKFKPAWVEAELAAMPLGSVQSNIFSWNKKLLRYERAGEYGKALAVFQELLDEGLNPNAFTFVPVLNACASLQALGEGRRIHGLIMQSSCKSDMYVESSLVDMYAKCGSIADAQEVFNKMQTRNVVTWNIMILGHVRCGQGQRALDLFEQMQCEGLEPDPSTFVGVVNACASMEAFKEGRCIHDQIIRKGFESDVFVGSSLLDMYAKCGSIGDAERVFQHMPLCDVVCWNAMILGYVKCGQASKALDVFGQMQQQKVKANCITFVGVVNACAGALAVEEGRGVHKQIILRGFEHDVFVGSSLVDMYCKCGSIEDASQVFEQMPMRNVVAWSAMILGHAKCGQVQKALELFCQMQQEGVEPNSITFVGVINACANGGALEDGKSVHELIIRKGFESDVYVGNSLIDMYAKCGSIEDAQRVFNRMRVRHVVAWNAIILGYVKYGEGKTALELFEQMELQGVEPDHVTFVAMLNACAQLEALQIGRHIHQQIVQLGYESNTFVTNGLIDMYTKCKSMKDAHRVFDKMPNCDVGSWNALIMGYVKSGQGQEALEQFETMQNIGVEPDHITFQGVLTACANESALDEGRRIHEDLILRGFKYDILVGYRLIDMYCKTGSMEDAHSVFDLMPARDVISWNVMIGGYVKCGQGHNALQLFAQMQQEAVEPNSATFAGALSACASALALDEGRHIHKLIIQRGCESDVFVGNSLINMYTKCGSLEDAWRVFSSMCKRDVVSWSTMVLGCVKYGQGEKALKLFKQMGHEGVEPDAVTFMGVLNACASIRGLEEGKEIHQQITRSCFVDNVSVGNSLVDMYAKCGSLDDAWKVLKKMPRHNVVAWTALIMGYSACGKGQEALEIFRQMEQEGIEPDHVTYVGILNSCASFAALEEGRHVHEQIIQKGFESDVFVGGGLVDMYAKCGSLDDAMTVFNKMPTHDGVSWNAMLGGYAMHGQFMEALKHFEVMCQEEVKADRVTFVSLLSACSHAGLVDEGLYYFESMSTIYSVYPTSEHCTCIVDLLGRAGRLHEAEDVTKTMPFHLNASVWMSLLGACRVYGDVEMGERLAKTIVGSDPGNSSGYVLLSNIHAAAGNWDCSAKVQQQRMETDLNEMQSLTSKIVTLQNL